MLLLKNGIPFFLSAQAGDGNTGLFCQAKVRDNAGTSVLGTVSMPHVANGLYLGSYTPSATGYQHVVVEFYTDSGFTTPATTYPIGQDDIRVSTNDPDTLATSTALSAISSAISTVNTVVSTIRKIVRNKKAINEAAKTLTVLDDDGSTPFLVWNLFREDGTTPTAGNLIASDVHVQTPTTLP